MKLVSATTIVSYVNILPEVDIEAVIESFAKDPSGKEVRNFLKCNMIELSFYIIN